MHVCPQCGESAEEPGSCPRDQVEMRDAQGDEFLGLQLGSHRLARLLGTGGMGRVYLGVHPEIGSRVAIKIFSRDVDGRTDLVERFFAEARATNLIGNEHIINVLDVNRLDGGRPYMVMEHLRGLPLAKLIGSETLTDEGIIQIMLDVLDGLDAAHAHKIVHRDLKPDNIFVSPGGNATLLDFGVAKLVPEVLGESGPTATGAILGTPHYMSPEQAVGDPVDARTDIYALGVILFECFTGQRPFRGTSLYKLLDQHVHEEPPSPRSYRSDIGVDVEEVILQALAKSPEDRYQSATEMHKALEACGQAKVVGLNPASSMRIRIDTAEEGAHQLIAGPPSQAGEDAEPGALGQTASTVAERPKAKNKEERPKVGSKEKRRLDKLLWGGTALGVLAIVGYLNLRGDSAVRRPASSHGGVAHDAGALKKAANLANRRIAPPDAEPELALSQDASGTPDAMVSVDAAPSMDAGPPDAATASRPSGVAPLTLLNRAYRLAARQESDATLQAIFIRGLNAEGRVSLQEKDSQLTFSFHSRRMADEALARPKGEKMPGVCVLRVSFNKAGKPALERRMDNDCASVLTVSRPFCSMAELLEIHSKEFNGKIKANSRIDAEYTAVRHGRFNSQRWHVAVDGKNWVQLQPCQ